MKTRHVPPYSSSSAMTSTTASYRAKRRSRSEDDCRAPCEREKRHEAHVRERQEQLKRNRAASAAALRSRLQQHQQQQQQSARSSQRWPDTPRSATWESGLAPTPEKPTNKNKLAVPGRPATKGKPKAKGKPEIKRKPSPAAEKDQKQAESCPRGQGMVKNQLWSEELLVDDVRICEADMRRIIEEQEQLEEQQQQLEEQQQQLEDQPMALGLQAQAPANSQLLCPLAVALHSLVAEFLHAENYQLTLSVFCSEMPQRRNKPEAAQSEFRFSQDEVQNVLSAVLGVGGDTTDAISAAVQRSYYQEQAHPSEGQSLLRALLRVLMDGKQQQQQREKKTEKLPPKEEKEKICAPEPVTEQHDPTSRAVFVGPRLCESIHAMEQRLGELMRHMITLLATCAPPVEIVTEQDLEDILTVELGERERLLKAGQKLAPGETAILIPEPPTTAQAQEDADAMVAVDVGEIKLPAMHVEMPDLPQLFPQQIGFMATIRQSLGRLLRKEKQAKPNTLFGSFEQMQMLVSELCVNVSLLINVVNMSMEQEHAVGRHGGFKAGYHEGFGHGHYMGVQEGAQTAREEQPEPQLRPTEDVAVQAMAIRRKNVASQTRKKKVQLQVPQEQPLETSVERPVEVPVEMPVEVPVELPVERPVERPVEFPVELPAQRLQVEVATQTLMLHQVAVAIQTAPSQEAVATQTLKRKSPVQVAVATQTPQEEQEQQQQPAIKEQLAKGTQTKAMPSSKSYEAWIDEMLYSASGKVFLERVELSLKKAYDLQKRRLDDLFQVKLRHQSEMQQLSHRQSSWRTLCRHVEKESHSSVEARELVHKIFSLLQHYEDHQQLLSEKMQQTEQMVAEKSVRFMPVFNGGQESETPIYTTAASTSRTTGTSHSFPPALPPAAAAMEESPRYAYHQQRVPPLPAIVVVPPSQTRIMYTTSTNTTSSPQGTSRPPQGRSSPPQGTSPPPQGTSPSPQGTSHPPQGTSPSPQGTSHPPQGTSPPPQGRSSPLQGTTSPPQAFSSSYPASPYAATSYRASSYLASSYRASSYRASSYRGSSRAASSRAASSHAASSNGAATAVSSFEDALASAKNRMQQLEEESDLLEQNFLEYLERARQRQPEEEEQKEQQPKKKKFPRRRLEDAATEELKEQRMRTLEESEPELEPDNYQFTNTLAVARRKLLGDHFEPAIGKSPLRVSRDVAQVEEQTQQILYRVRSEFSQTTHLLPEITSPTHSSSNEELNVLMQRAKHAMRLNEQAPARSGLHLLDYSTSSTLTSGSNSSRSSPSAQLLFQPRQDMPGRAQVELEAATSPSTRLQRSMAKMQQLFAGAGIKPAEQSLPLPQPLSLPLPKSLPQSLPQPLPQPLPQSLPQPLPRATIRPVSAPTAAGGTAGRAAGGTAGRAAGGGRNRPHTAPTMQQQQKPQVQQAQKQQQSRQQQHQHFFPPTDDVLLLSSSHASSSADSSYRQYHATDVYEELLLEPSRLPSSPEILHSRNFWKRLNL